ncbi:hypothetical protein G4Y79_17075 [Phototrophicus methaneseepsis]|uniref:Cell division inhibitor n=1 Tax=Phototrophicus methaneseepsis TaxID=2710758 RepID=A0A7S8E6S0_9CHLR|nr:hypothetical protein [Phototrophicus methaneseepsis]QPC81399.1 hypothetical protein G4Y79_17075 [Phototrophicus methaneseepsis]
MYATERSLPENARIFEQRSVIKTTMAAMEAFHQDPAALKKLTPLPIIAQLQEDHRTSLTAGDIRFTLWFGPVPVRWHAQHEEGPTPTSFADRQLEGPMAYWRHEHIFEDVPNGIQLTDRITLAHRQGITGLLTRLFFDGLPLRILFTYRHLRTRLSLSYA